jgi:hypothetical protein
MRDLAQFRAEAGTVRGAAVVGCPRATMARFPITWRQLAPNDPLCRWRPGFCLRAPIGPPSIGLQPMITAMPSAQPVSVLPTLVLALTLGCGGEAASPSAVNGNQAGGRSPSGGAPAAGGNSATGGTTSVCGCTRGIYRRVCGVDGKFYDASCGIECVPVAIACEGVTCPCPASGGAGQGGGAGSSGIGGTAGTTSKASAGAAGVLGDGFTCGASSCNVGESYCYRFLPGVPGASETLSCLAIPANCADPLSCDCVCSTKPGGCNPGTGCTCTVTAGQVRLTCAGV